MAFQIPKEGRKSLADLLKQTPAFLDAFYEALKDCPPQLMPRGQSHLASKLKAFPGADEKTLGGYVKVLLGALSGVGTDVPAEKTAAELVASAQSSADKELGASNPGWENVRPFLARTFGIDKIRISARALGLFYDSPRHVHASRILTDARPVFPGDPAGEPTGFVIVHTLRLDYHENNQYKDWFVSLDITDLEQLKVVVDRAIEKQKSLKKFLERTRAVVFTPYETDNDSAST
jgi:hypothetical protein